MDRRAWWATVHGVTKSRTPLSDQHTKTCPQVAGSNFLWLNNIPLYTHTTTSLSIHLLKDISFVVFISCVLLIMLQ